MEETRYAVLSYVIVSLNSKTRKGLLKSWIKTSREVIILHDINDSIVISYPYYSVVYQDEAKMVSLQRDKCIYLGWKETNKKLTKICWPLLMK